MARICSTSAETSPVSDSAGVTLASGATVTAGASVTAGVSAAAGAAVGSELSAFVPPQPARDSTSRAHSSMVIVFFILVLSS